MPIFLIRYTLWIGGGLIALGLLYVIAVAIIAPGSINAWFSPYEDVIQKNSAELPDPATVVFEGVSLESPLANIDPGPLGLKRRYDPTIGPIFEHQYCFGATWPTLRAPTLEEWHRYHEHSVVRSCIENPYGRTLETRFTETVDFVSSSFDTEPVLHIDAVPGDEPTRKAMQALAGNGELRLFATGQEDGLTRYELYAFSDSRIGEYMTHCRQRIVDARWACDVYVPVNLKGRTFHLMLDLGFDIAAWQQWQKAVEHGLNFVQNAADQAASTN